MQKPKVIEKRNIIDMAYKKIKKQKIIKQPQQQHSVLTCSKKAGINAF